MSLYPRLTLTFLNGFLLILPLLALRFGIPALRRREALASLDHFPPVKGTERIARQVYFVTNTFLVFSPLLARIVTGAPWSLAGWACYALGLAVLGAALWNFCSASGVLVRVGLYRFSRNPIYVGYFLVFAGTALLIGSWSHLALTLVYQAAVHFLILSEERWCLAAFGWEYADYLRRVRRYL